jgi:hypothetical protein
MTKNTTSTPGFFFREDNREPHWKEIEKQVQSRAFSKDKNFRLSGKWKKFIRKEGDLAVYKVESEWVRNNLSVHWAHGGHGFVYEFIPMDEIWVGDTHPVGCECQGLNQKRGISERYFESTVVHELVELGHMRAGMIYWEAHQLAIVAEHKLKKLVNAYIEDYRPLDK